MSIAAARVPVRKQKLDADAVPLSLQAGDLVMVLLPVEIRRRNHDGTFHVIGSGINRTVEAAELVRRREIDQ